MVPPTASQRRRAMSRPGDSQRQGSSASTTLLHSSSVTVVCQSDVMLAEALDEHVNEVSRRCKRIRSKYGCGAIYFHVP